MSIFKHTPPYTVLELTTQAESIRGLLKDRDTLIQDSRRNTNVIQAEVDYMAEAEQMTRAIRAAITFYNKMLEKVNKAN